MPGFFEVLLLPCKLSVSTVEIDAAWRSQSQKFHPDVVGDEGEGISSRVNEARDTLLKASGRLSEWLIVNCGEAGSRTTSLSGELMGLFSEVGEALREADQTLGSIKKAQSALARSLIASRAIVAQKSIQAQMAKISADIEGVIRRFPEFEESGKNDDFRDAKAALGELKFLEKWQRECQQRLLELISVD